MTQSDEVTLKELIVERFGYVDQKIETVRKDVERLENKVDLQQSVHLDCLARQGHEKNAIWAAIGKQDTKQAKANGFREGEHYARERHEWWHYINWEKWCAVGAFVGVMVMIFLKIA